MIAIFRMTLRHWMRPPDSSMKGSLGMKWIEEEELLKITGYKSRGWLARALDKQGIRYIRGRKGRIVVPASSIERLVEDSKANTVEFI